jgi:hypothetical protein
VPLASSTVFLESASILYTCRWPGTDVFRLYRVRGLTIILQDVDIQLPGYDIDDRQRKQLGEISHNCETLLNEVQDAIGKYKVVEYCGTSIHKKARSIWKRIAWEPKDIGELRDRLLSNVTLLQSFLSAISRYCIYLLPSAPSETKVHLT